MLRDRIDAMFPDASKIELFARDTCTDQWETWGDGRLWRVST